MGDAGPPTGVEWDRRKAASNAEKHGLTFEEGLEVLLHPQAYTNPTPRVFRGEVREVTFAPGRGGQLLAVVYTRRGGTVRIISTRRASRRERRRYADATGAAGR